MTSVSMKPASGLSLTNIKISKRVFGGFGMVVALLAGACVVSTWNVGRIDESFSAYKQRVAVEGLVVDVRRDFVNYRRLVREYALTGRNEVFKSASSAEGVVRATYEKANAGIHAPERRSKLAELNTAVNEYVSLFGKSVSMRKQLDEAIEKELDPLGAAMEVNMQKLLEVSRATGNIEQLDIAGRALNSVMLMRLHVNRALGTERADAQASAETAFKELRDMRPTLKGAFANSIGAKMVGELETGAERYHATAGQEINRKVELSGLINGRMAELASLVSKSVDAMVDSATVDQHVFEEQTRGLINDIRSMMLMLGASGVLLAAALAWVIGRSVSKPIVGMTETMQKMASGDLSVDIPSTQAGDETGDMARAVEVFKSQGLRARELEREAELSRQAAEQDRKRKEEDAAALAREQAAVVEKLANGLVQLSEGDLTTRLSDLPRAYAQIGEDFNTALQKLEEAFGSIAGGSRGIHSASAEIAQASDDLAKRTEQQAASLEETAAALGEITSRVRDSAKGASHAREVVMSVKSDAEKSGAIVKDAISAMDQIEKSASEISKIIGVIDEIAFQTNLLALNAGVEAARAGEAGRGFAVVASEVRALAQRSAEAAKEIKSLISRSTSQVETGVELVGSTGVALTRIVELVAEAAQTVTGIASSAHEQANGLQEVNTAVSQMDQITQQNAAMVEEATAASHSLQVEAEHLKGLIDQFRTSAGAGQVVPMAQAARAPSRARKPASVPVKAMRSVGSAALKAAEQPADDSWTEF